MTRRRRFGSVRKLPSGRWQARYIDTLGQPQTAPQTFATKTDADRWLSLVEADLARGDWRDPRLGRITFGEWADEWLATTVHLKPKTRDGYETVLRAHLRPAFGAAPVAAIDTPAVRRFVAEMLAAGSAPGTVMKARQVLRSVLACAREAGAVKTNACDGVKIGRPHRRETKFLTPQQIERLAEAITKPTEKGRTYPEYGLLVRFAAYTGLRAGEIGAVRVGRLDLMRGRVEVSESLAHVPGHGFIFGETKNYQRRTVPIPRFLLPDLVEHLERSGISRDPEALVFRAPEGGPLRHLNFYRRHYLPAAKRAELPKGLRFHDLRHTCAALLISQGAHQLAVMRRLGHSTITVTIDTYGHLFPEVEEALTDRLDELARTARPAEDAVVLELPPAAHSEPDLEAIWHVDGTAATEGPTEQVG